MPAGGDALARCSLFTLWRPGRGDGAPTPPPPAGWVGAVLGIVAGMELEAAGGGARVEGEVRCLNCGYDLRGLAREGACPECGAAVADSLRGNLLRYASAEYLKTLHTGVFLVQASIIVQIVGTLGMVVVVAATVGAGAMVATLAEHAITLLLSAAALMSVAGWWMFSSPNPAETGEDRGVTARQVVRATVVISALGTIANQVAGVVYVPAPGAVGAGGAMPSDLVGMAIAATGVISTIAWAVWFFAAMRYLRWLAPRLPDVRVYERAKLMMWLGPVLVIFGCGIGWLVALVMYYNLLEWVRVDLKGIRAEREAAVSIKGQMAKGQ